MESLSFKNFREIPEKEITSITVAYNNNKHKVDIIKSLSFEETLSFVKDVVDNSFIDGEYEATVKKLAFNEALIRYYVISHDSLGAEQVNWIMYNTDIIDVILSTVNLKQITDIEAYINEQIEYKLHREYNRTNIDEFVKNGSEFIDTLREKIKDIDLEQFIKEIVPDIPTDELITIIKEFMPKNRQIKLKQK